MISNFFRPRFGSWSFCQNNEMSSAKIIKFSRLLLHCLDVEYLLKTNFQNREKENFAIKKSGNIQKYSVWNLSSSSENHLIEHGNQIWLFLPIFIFLEFHEQNYKKHYFETGTTIQTKLTMFRNRIIKQLWRTFCDVMHFYFYFIFIFGNVLTFF